MSKLVKFGALLAVVSLTVTLVGQTLSQPTPTGRKFEGRAVIADDEGEGRRLMQTLIGAPPQSDSMLYGTLVVRDANDKRIETPIRWLTKVEDTNTWHDVFETQAVVGQPAQRLIITHVAGGTNRYALATATAQTNAFPPPKALTREQIFKPFVGSDYWIADLGLDFYHWPTARIVKTEMRQGRSCRVVECINPSPAPGAYNRVLCWIDFQSGGLVRAEAFDEANKRLKVFSVRKIKRIEGRVQLREIEMRNDQTDSSTVLEFELEVDDPAK
jgi:hypothetical protein